MEHEIREYDGLMELLEDLEREGITGLEKRRHVENFMLRKSRLRGRPYCASFELTPLCNFNCKMCYMHLTKEQMEREGRMLTTEEWLSIAQQSVDAGVTAIDLTGGECLTHPGFCEIYMYLINRGVHVSVLTNGQLITDEHVQMFRKYKPSVVQISLYGSNSEAYVKVTGRDGFQDVMNAISRLKAAGIHLKLSVTPNRFMQEDMPTLLDLVHGLEVGYTIGSTTLPARPETERDIADYVIEDEAFIRLCKLETEHRSHLRKNTSGQPSDSFQFRLKGQETFEGPPCASGTANFHINWKGEMTPCTAFHAVKKSVQNGQLEAAWLWIRETMKHYQEPQECQLCDLKSVCRGCVAEKTSGILNGSLNTWVCRRMRISTVRSEENEKRI